MPPWNILLGRGSKAGGSSSSTSEGASPTPGSNALSDQADAQQADSVEEADPIPLTAKGRAKSNKIPKKKDSLIKQYYKRYELDWPDLRRWLEAKFEGIEFKEGYDSTKDFYVFEVPRELTKAEVDEIKTLRKDYRP